jgi:hypothetical protein
MTLLLSLVGLAVAVTTLALMRSSAARERAAEFPETDPAAALAPVSDPRRYLDAIVRAGH